jgi:hypothetical protein
VVRRGRGRERRRWLRRLVWRGMREAVWEEGAAGNLGNDEVDGKRGLGSVLCTCQMVMVLLTSMKFIHLISQRCLHEMYHLGCNRRSRKVEPTETEEVR